MDITTTLQDQTTLQPEDNTSTEDLSTTTDPSETTTIPQQALFFFNSNEEDDEEESTTETATTKSKAGLLEAAHLDPVFSTHSDGDAKQTANFVRFPSDDEYPSYASRFKHEYDFDDDFSSDDHVPSSSWSSSQLDFKFPSRYRHSGRDFHSESYYRGFPGGSDVAHLFRHRPRGRFR